MCAIRCNTSFRNNNCIFFFLSPEKKQYSSTLFHLELEQTIVLNAQKNYAIFSIWPSFQPSFQPSKQKSTLIDMHEISPRHNVTQAASKEII